MHEKNHLPICYTYTKSSCFPSFLFAISRCTKCKTRLSEIQNWKQYNSAFGSIYIDLLNQYERFGIFLKSFYCITKYSDCCLSNAFATGAYIVNPTCEDYALLLRIIVMQRGEGEKKLQMLGGRKVQVLHIRH